MALMPGVTFAAATTHEWQLQKEVTAPGSREGTLQEEATLK